MTWTDILLPTVMYMILQILYWRAMLMFWINPHIYVCFSGRVQSRECIQDVIRFAADEELFLLVDEESV